MLKCRMRHVASRANCKALCALIGWTESEIQCGRSSYSSSFQQGQLAVSEI